MSDWQGTGTTAVDLEWADKFRTDFSEFSDNEKFTDEMIMLWQNIGNKLIDSVHFLKDETIRNYILELWVAHHIIMQHNEQINAMTENYSGEGVKPVSGYGVGDVSISYDNGSLMENDGGDWNSSVYGRKLLRLIRNLCVAYQV